MAYKIPPGHPVGVAINVAQIGTRVIPMTTISSTEHPTLNSWNDATGADTIIADNK